LSEILAATPVIRHAESIASRFREAVAADPDHRAVQGDDQSSCCVTSRLRRHNVTGHRQLV
jgi:hypothetical protein